MDHMSLKGIRFFTVELDHSTCLYVVNVFRTDNSGNDEC